MLRKRLDMQAMTALMMGGCHEGVSSDVIALFHLRRMTDVTELFFCSLTSS